MKISMVVPYYNNPGMLKEQTRIWRSYGPEITADLQIILVDDGSPKPAADALDGFNALELYRINEDIPWNLGGALNLGGIVAIGDWLLLLEIDHTIQPEELKKLMAWPLDESKNYKFTRVKHWNGGKTNPAIGASLVTRENYWRAGGHDEDFAGHLGTHYTYSDALKLITSEAILPITVSVYGAQEIPDCSTTDLDRDPKPNEILYERKKAGEIRVSDEILRFTWERII